MTELHRHYCRALLIFTLAVAGNVGAQPDVKRSRSQLLKQILAQRKELLNQKANVDNRIGELQDQMRDAAADYARAAKEAESVKAAIRREELPGERRALEQRYAQLDADATKANFKGRAIDTQLKQSQASLSKLYSEADQLRLEFLDLIDPFGKLDRQEHEAALTVLSEWIVLDGQNADGFIARGFAYWHMGRTSEALVDFSRAVSLESSGSTLALAARGGLRHKLGEQKAGIADLGKAMSGNKQNPLAYSFRALANWRDGKFVGVEQDLLAAHRLSPRETRFLCYLSLFKSSCPVAGHRNSKKAMDHALKAVQLKGTDWFCLYAQAAAYAEAGNFKLDVQDAESALKFSNADQHKMCQDAIALFKVGQPLRLASAQQ